MNNALAWSQYDSLTQPGEQMTVVDIDRTAASNRGDSSEYNKLHPVFAINIDGKLRLLRKAIELSIRCEDGYYFSENEKLNVSGYGESVREALQEATSEISYFYNYYLSLNDVELVGQGLELKRIYSEIL